MTLSEFVKNYRQEHDLSIRAFASMVDLSIQQVSNIEKGIGNNGKPMTSTHKTYVKIADGIGMPQKDFFKMLNDEVVVNSSDEKEPVLSKKNGNENNYEEFMQIVRQLTAENVELLKDQGLLLLKHQKSQGDQ